MDNETLVSSNMTLFGDEVGKIESIKLRDGSPCDIENEKYGELLPYRGMCIAGQCQVNIRR